jgi:hypothetical protein
LRTLGYFFGGGASTTGQAVQRAPPKNTGLPLAGPDQARSLRLSPSRSTACRRDPRRRRTHHPSCYLRQAPRPRAPRRRQTHWRVLRSRQRGPLCWLRGPSCRFTPRAPRWASSPRWGAGGSAVGMLYTPTTLARPIATELWSAARSTAALRNAGPKREGRANTRDVGSRPAGCAEWRVFRAAPGNWQNWQLAEQV